ncbi:MAG: HNH endonuclease, partial [Ilumatobacter sp.]|nr:HNH endonuclease [Ilumatobacter sp.]
CRIHHIHWWWKHHGPTNLDNLIPLCEQHHHLVHEGGWNLTMTPDRTATWTRPDGQTYWTGPLNDRQPVAV